MCRLELGSQLQCHFIVKEGIVLEHKTSVDGIEVDQGKIQVIEKLSHPISVNVVRRFLSHVGLCRTFVKVFSKISIPVCKLLEKENTFVFNNACLNAFKRLKEKLVSAPTIIALDWNPFLNDVQH